MSLIIFQFCMLLRDNLFLLGMLLGMLLVMLLFVTGHVTGECVLANVSRLTSLLLCQVCPQYSNHSLINRRKPRNESENREMSNKKFGRRRP